MRGLIPHSSFNRDFQQSEAFTSEILDFIIPEKPNTTSLQPKTLKVKLRQLGTPAVFTFREKQKQTREGAFNDNSKKLFNSHLLRV